MTAIHSFFGQWRRTKIHDDSAQQITSDKIYGAICVYLLFGYAWTFAYALLDELQPGSFTASNEIGSTDYVGRVMQLRYFSFMILTTVGYGDVVPRSPAARTMAMLEGLMGQFYLVALIGRLVGLPVQKRVKDRPAGGLRSHTMCWPSPHSLR